MNHSVESIQLLGHARVPAPPWVAVNRVAIPIKVSNVAAQIIIECFGQKEIDRVVGGKGIIYYQRKRSVRLNIANLGLGREWWQQRVANKGIGVQGEWIWIKSQEQARRKAYQSTKQRKEHRKAAPDENGYSQDEYTSNLDDQRCIYYIHGGGYYFGSIDIYRYTIWRYARKINGRAFALKYRLAPQ